MIEDVREKSENEGVLNKEPREHQNQKNQKSGKKSKQGRRKKEFEI